MSAHKLEEGDVDETSGGFKQKRRTDSRVSLSFSHCLPWADGEGQELHGANVQCVGVVICSMKTNTALHEPESVDNSNKRISILECAEICKK